ncbi:MAG: SGNH/GDSL hydrolase family protein [Planctomycetaceae bacterium]|nr:SGNH/GDSL hydrolase family protein [Planctomycetaceae bacterium]
MQRRFIAVVLVAGLALSSRAVATPPEYAPVTAREVQFRDGLGNVLAKLDAGGDVKVAYFGGSITAAAGWRVQTLEWFRQAYPNANVSEINAAIGGTGSDLGVFRLGHDVLSHEPDLVFVEFAVNDGGASPERIWQAMEGIVQQIWTADPHTDICYVYTFRTGYENDLNQGLCPRAASAMEMLAQHYGIPSVNVAMPVCAMQREGKLIFKSDEPTPEGVLRFSSDGVHPLTEGHQLYTDLIAQAVTEMRKTSKPTDHRPKLATIFVEDNWQAAKMVPITEKMLSGDWKRLPDGDPLARSFGGRMGPLWYSGTPGSRITFKFRGSLAKLYDLLGPDGGQVVVTVDGKNCDKPVPRFDSYCTYHRIATLSIVDGLDPSETHTVVVEIHPDQPDRSPVAFRLKDPDTELKAPKFQGTKVRVSQILLLGDLVE